MPSREILLVDDNPADAALVHDALDWGARQSRLTCLLDGEEALAHLRERSSPLPDLMILDLNLPKKDGRAVLSEVRADPRLRKIAVVIFSSSQSQDDIARSYELGANCFVSKPVNLDGFFMAVRSIEEFWCGCASLPAGGQ
jgi:two-component system, chemotaxis family, response regulator Rcp1